MTTVRPLAREPRRHRSVGVGDAGRTLAVRTVDAGGWLAEHCSKVSSRNAN